MRVRKVLFLIIFLFSSNSIIASEIDGIRIFQSAEGFLKIDNDKDRELEFNKNIRFYWNDSFNLSSSVHDNNDFKIPNPDYFFNEYLIFEKEKKVIGIIRDKKLASKILQQTFKIGECEQLRNQLVLEKEVKFNAEIKKTKSNSFFRFVQDNAIYFEDRLAFNYTVNDNNVSHNFSCYYKIHFEKDASLGKKHLITNTLAEEILETNLFNQFEIFDKYKKILEFNSNYIKNFKIWGNLDEINYDKGEIFSLSSYRSESFTKHQIEAEKKEIEKIKKDKILKLKKEINKKKEKLSKEINLLNKPLLRLEDNLKKEINKENKLIIRIEEQKKNFQSNFIYNYGNCFPGSISKFVSPLESVYAKLELTNKSDFINYSINYIKFNNNDKSLFFFDFVRDKVKCKINSSIFVEYDVLDLNTIRFRFFNKVNTFNLEIPEIKIEINNKLKKINKKFITLNNEIKEYNKNLSFETNQLIKKFNSEIASIENQTKVIDKKILKLDENYKPILSTSKLVDLDNIAKLLDKAKEDTVEEIKKNNDITQDQDKSVVTSGLTLSEQDALKAQIFGCWSIPLGLPYNENLLVRIKIELKPDGSIAKTEILDHARMNKPGQSFYKVLAESALRAVKLCQPLRVPTTGYERWKTITINFDAREMLGG